MVKTKMREKGKWMKPEPEEARGMGNWGERN